MPLRAVARRGGSGHRNRLHRDQSGKCGSSTYACEVLAAEMCAAFSCASLGIWPTVRHADYVVCRLDVLRKEVAAICVGATDSCP
ncbi:hypothetical protein LK533_10450 [Sphingomonas sp. PL-96]|uniref:zincin-like metallopeptidase domain-containing protein n=1 Tax=Sphingomonas sp. PL-96 TaxID=2887201 RepID=UPI001E565BA5|nr:zincin-like metallopeptidase domain-containing protein [Sphingomonas sp. PL-96]MCC2977091.1 hypothetical protein [Sphingomonas sp. PL-96]